MKDTEFKALKQGDVVIHVNGGIAYVVTGNYDSYVIGVSTAHMTNPAEWILATKKEAENLGDRMFICPSTTDICACLHASPHKRVRACMREFCASQPSACIPFLGEEEQEVEVEKSPVGIRKVRV